MGLAFYCLYSLSLDATKVNNELLTRPKKPDVHFSSFFLFLPFLPNTQLSLYMINK